MLASSNGPDSFGSPFWNWCSVRCTGKETLLFAMCLWGLSPFIATTSSHLSIKGLAFESFRGLGRTALGGSDKKLADQKMDVKPLCASHVVEGVVKASGLLLTSLKYVTIVQEQYYLLYIQIWQSKLSSLTASQVSSRMVGEDSFIDLASQEALSSQVLPVHRELHMEGVVI